MRRDEPAGEAERTPVARAPPRAARRRAPGALGRAHRLRSGCRGLVRTRWGPSRARVCIRMAPKPRTRCRHGQHSRPAFDRPGAGRRDRARIAGDLPSLRRDARRDRRGPAALVGSREISSPRTRSTSIPAWGRIETREEHSPRSSTKSMAGLTGHGWSTPENWTMTEGPPPRQPVGPDPRPRSDDGTPWMVRPGCRSSTTPAMASSATATTC